MRFYRPGDAHVARSEPRLTAVSLVCHDFLVARADRALVGVVAFALVTGLGLVGWLLWPDGDPGGYRVALGTVVAPAACGPPDARDSLRVDLLDGRAVPAELDGCGNRLGEVLTVEVPDPLPAEDVVVRLAGTGVPAATATVQRLSAVLVAIAGIAGALLAWRLTHDRR